MARVSLIDPAAASEAVRPQLEQMARERGRVFNIYRAMAHSPNALAAVTGLARALWFESELPRPLQELIILRVAQLTGSDYEWGRHRLTARTVGLADAKVEALGSWRDSDAYDAAERAALTLVDETTRDIEASAEAVAELRRHFSEQQTVEITLLAGMYRMVAGFLRSLAIDQEAGDERLPTG